ncbi:alanine racemase [Nocardioides sp. zg-579]|uniref:Alanine racemase n=1 Tax=Nocardioides marmotae TaxID=2663857 RepID=A0A6I3JDY0_9ACTN|nr:alanine racemase [Nocardioides marmotae]MCR6032653.1 alanine racemase [Gordonia jinghuaiqii]MTB96302.1 alanine racemase [Nocardioides marmotae]QKE03209.1 alanine racemase [Nocardioides marmotae]
MSLVLHVDGERWRAHLRSVADAHPGLVPVCKGNGYGFTLARLARKSQWLGVDTIAVGTYDELSHVATRFDGSLLVLTPWRPFGAALEVDPALADRVVHTVSRPQDLTDLLARQPDARFVLERMTSMQRHGHGARELWASADSLRAHPRARLEGVALHLPLAQGSHLGEVERLLNDVVAAELDTHTIWVSHLTDHELATLRASYADYEIRPRVGTALWLGDRGALRVTATVLDVHPVERGDSFGYRGRTAPKSGHLLVVSGGTAHGIGLEAPTGDSGIRARAATLARGGLDAVGFVRSPFSIDGKQRLFAEPPHMQASMLFLPSGSHVPEVGDEVDVRVRFTATAFDRVVVE